MIEVDGKTYFTYEEVAEKTGYSRKYVSHAANAPTNNYPYVPDLSEYKRKFGERSAYLSKEAVDILKKRRASKA